MSVNNLDLVYGECAMKFQDYYEVLGVTRDASPEDIKKAYQKLALKWHPDRHKEDTRAAAEEKFKQVNEAKEVLLDAEKRKKYDQFGQNWEHGQEFNPPPPGSGTRRVSPEEFEQMFGGGGFSDFFTNMFGDETAARFGRRGRHARYSHRGADVRADLHLTIGEAIAGGKRNLALDTEMSCPTCGGVGFLEEEHVCPSCAGLGRVRSRKQVELTIPKDVREGMKLRLRGLGEAGERGGEQGDLYLTLHLDSDDIYRRAGDDIEADLPLAPWEALEGAKVDLRALDGAVTLTVPPNTQSGAKLRLRGLGLAHEQGGRGDLYAVVRYALPEKLTEQQKELIRQLKAAGEGKIGGGARGG
ncbi:MAG: J domain-containing protein [Planctomycetes bacterium]|nr:J domain-containing protein [Planctomycetota bacterium]